jgi:hypothetical protein
MHDASIRCQPKPNTAYRPHGLRADASPTPPTTTGKDSGNGGGQRHRAANQYRLLLVVPSELSLPPFPPICYFVHRQALLK